MYVARTPFVISFSLPQLALNREQIEVPFDLRIVFFGFFFFDYYVRVFLHAVILVALQFYVIILCDVGVFVAE